MLCFTLDCSKILTDCPRTIEPSYIVNAFIQLVKTFCKKAQYQKFLYISKFYLYFKIVYNNVLKDDCADTA